MHRLGEAVFSPAQRALPLGERLLAVMQSAVEADVDLVGRWGGVKPVNDYVTAGKPIDAVYSGLDHLHEEEIWSLQSFIDKHELVPSHESMPVNPSKVLESLRNAYLQKRANRWNDVYAQAFRGSTVQIKRPAAYEEDRRRTRPLGYYLIEGADYYTEGRGHTNGKLAEGQTIMGVIRNVSLYDQNGVLELISGIHSYGESEQPFRRALIRRLFDDRRDGPTPLGVVPTVEITTPPPPPGIAMSDALAA